jgi:hypothetical protein
MNALKRFLILTSFTLLMVFPFVARSDTIELKIGTTVEGDIVSESDTEVVMEVRIGSGSIMRRTFNRAEIASVTRETPEQKRARAMADAFRKIQVYQLNPTNNYPLAHYDQVIKGAFQPFLDAYPDSVHAADIKARVASWEQERQQVADGKVKREGRWLTEEEVRALEQERKAKQLEAEVKTQLEQKQYDKAVPALEQQIRAETDADRKAELEQQLEKAYKAWATQLAANIKQAETSAKQLQIRLDITAQSRDAAKDEFFTIRERYLGDENNALGMRAQLAISKKKLDKLEADTQAQTNQLIQAEKQIASLKETVAKVDFKLGDIRAAKERAARAAAEAARLAMMEKERETPKEPLAPLEPFEVPTDAKTQEVSHLSQPEPLPPPPPPAPRKQEAFSDWLEKNWVIAGIGLVLSIGLFIKIIKK